MNALELYNAVNGTNYTNIEDLEFYTIENAVYMSMKNDVAICFESILNLFEHQSTLKRMHLPSLKRAVLK